MNLASTQSIPMYPNEKIMEVRWLENYSESPLGVVQSVDGHPLIGQHLSFEVGLFPVWMENPHGKQSHFEDAVQSNLPVLHVFVTIKNIFRTYRAMNLEWTNVCIWSYAWRPANQKTHHRNTESQPSDELPKTSLGGSHPWITHFRNKKLHW